MAIRTILHYPDKRLRDRAEPVAAVTPEIVALIDDMTETMYAAPGCGLAAPQIGVALRLFVVDIAGEDEPSDARSSSTPRSSRARARRSGKRAASPSPASTKRSSAPPRSRCAPSTSDGKPFELAAEGLLAVAIQHENDHLDGVLMIDHMGALKRRLALRKLQKRSASAEL